MFLFQEKKIRQIGASEYGITNNVFGEENVLYCKK